MRKEVRDYLPKTLASDKDVLVVGPEDAHGLNILKTQIADMNRGEKWIKVEFRDIVAESKVTSRVGVVLTMYKVKPTTVNNMKTVAAKLNIPCPPQALTVGEVKEILVVLDKLRNSTAEVVVQNGKNGKGLFIPPFHNPAQAQQANDEKGIDPVVEITQAVDVNTVKSEVKVSQEPVQEVNHIESAFETLEKFRNSIEDTQIALLTISDELKTVTEERNELRIQVEAQDQQILNYSSAIEGMKRFVKEKEKEIEILNAEVTRLRVTFANFEALIKGAQSK